MFKKEERYLKWMIRLVGLYHRRWPRITKFSFNRWGENVSVLVYFIYKKKTYVISMISDTSWYNLNQMPIAFIKSYERIIKRVSK